MAAVCSLKQSLLLFRLRERVTLDGLAGVRESPRDVVGVRGARRRCDGDGDDVDAVEP